MPFTTSIPSVPIDTPVLLSTADEVLTSAGFGMIEDVSPYNSVHIRLELFGGTWNDNDVAELEIRFFDVQPVFAQSGEGMVFVENWFFYNGDENIPLTISQPVNGSWMSVVIRDRTGAGIRTTNLKMQIYGSYRQNTNVWVRPHPAAYSYEGSNVLFDQELPFAGAGTFNFNAKPGVGRAILRLETTAASANVLVSYCALISNLRDTLAITAAGMTKTDLILPTRQARLSITSSAAQTVRVSMIQERYPQ